MVTTAAPWPETSEEQERLTRAAEERCQKSMNEDNGTLLGYDVSCPPVWDTILCWERTPPGQLAKQKCPRYIVGFIEQENASRQCLENGSWYYNPEFNREWTNFTRCVPGTDPTVFVKNNLSVTGLYEYVPKIKFISTVGYSVSLISLIAAFLIFACIKRLHCPRNVLHMHLYASFMLRAFTFFTKDLLFGLQTNFVSGIDGDYYSSQSNSNWPCRMMTTLWNYCIMANYSWILMEGLYLHNLIFLALFTDSSSITLYVALGWGLPVMFIIPWAICRVLRDNVWCWTTNDDKLVYQFMSVPIIISIILSFILFVNIIRVLWHKLRSSVCEETKKYRRWGKSTLVLVPLFGVHYMIFLGLSFRPGTLLEVTWLFCDQFFASFNGFFVAILYCFLNGEVRAEMAKRRLYWPPEALGCAGFPLLLPCVDRRRRRSHSTTHGGALSSAGPANGRTNGDAEADADAANGSCYSSTAYTSVSMPPASHCCHPGRRRGSQQAQVKLDAQNTQDGVKEPSPKSQDRRWSVSDCDLEKNALELRCMTAPNNICVRL